MLPAGGPARMSAIGLLHRASTAAKKTRQARVIPNEFSLKLFACAIGPFRAAFRRLDLPADLNEFWF
jgi:hypothetical protein